MEVYLETFQKVAAEYSTIELEEMAIALSTKPLADFKPLLQLARKLQPETTIGFPGLLFTGPFLAWALAQRMRESKQNIS